MAGFNFERDLPHQSAAIEAVVEAFDLMDKSVSTDSVQNTLIDFAGNLAQLKSNVRVLQKKSLLKESLQVDDPENLIFDISMETGTGKTYTYTKTLFELNKEFNIFKFVIAVPRVAIKAGTVSFLKSEAAKEHFEYEFGKKIRVYEVQSTKKTKGKKERMPQSIVDFCKVDSRINKDEIHVLVINSGMINSPTMEKTFDVTLFDKFSVAFDAIAYTRPVLIIDEPHLFKTENKTFVNLRRIKPQFTLRFGATFDGDFKNLIYQLNAVDAFNQDLVKGIVAHVETFPEAANTAVKLVGLDKEATFELSEAGKSKKSFKMLKKESMEKIHSAMNGLEVSEFNKTKLILSNGLELRKGDSINPFSYADTLQNKMLQQAIVRHFEIEKELLSQSPRIKPLSLFFIDNIPSYRDKNGAMRLYFEQALIVHIKMLIAKEKDAWFKSHLQAALKDIALLHGGYFSADNSDKDEAVEQETLEILHDKEALLNLTNPRRFIFSKWTLREGWDNPNIFQICKLRSSGSETSKLQEVGRGLRLPVNEFMCRDKNKTHDLHYYVDFTETDFIEKLTGEINNKSGVNYSQTKLDDILIGAILKAYPNFSDDEELLDHLGERGIIKRNNDFKDGGFEKLKAELPNAFGNSLKGGKVKSGTTSRPKTSIRQGVYEELKQLWESINRKVILEYKLDNEQGFKTLFRDYLIEKKSQFIKPGSLSVQQRLTVEKNRVSYKTEDSIHAVVLPFRMMNYKTFITTLAKDLALSINMLHNVFGELLANGELNINDYMSLATIREIKKGFNEYLMANVFGKFSVNYRQTTNAIHPTKLTNEHGEPLSSIDSADVGVNFEDSTPPASYLFNEIFSDSTLEFLNIKNPPKEVIVYTKIPKNSIRIPLVGGGTYSPDFAYVVKTSDDQTVLNLIVESKKKTENALAVDEAKRIEHAEAFFNQLNSGIKVSFKKQLSNTTITSLINESLGKIH